MFFTGQVQLEQSFRLFPGFGLRVAMERDGPGNGAQTQPLAASGSGSSFVQVVAQSLAGSGSDVTGFDDATTVTSQYYYSAAGGVGWPRFDAQPVAVG